MSYSVGDVAALAGITVRTLHHYDEVGLLSPSGRTPAGYRMYGDDDVERLQQILFYKELGFPLEEIATILDDPRADASTHLRRQRGLLLDRINRLQALVAAVERAMEAQRMGYQLTPEEKLEIFGDWQPPSWYAEELAKRRRGSPPPAARDDWPPKTKEEWRAVERNRRQWAERIYAVMESGVAPDSAEALEMAEEYRVDAHQSHEMLVAIMDWYARQPELFGFMVRPDEQLPGMAAWFRDAIRANAARAGIEA